MESSFLNFQNNMNKIIPLVGNQEKALTNAKKDIQRLQQAENDFLVEALQMELTNSLEHPNDFVSENSVEVLQMDLTNTLQDPGKNIYSTTIQRLPPNL
jgi:hypothetical protein